jgi:hypothetical protein
MLMEKDNWNDQMSEGMTGTLCSTHGRGLHTRFGCRDRRVEATKKT